MKIKNVTNSIIIIGKTIIYPESTIFASEELLKSSEFQYYKSKGFLVEIKSKKDEEKEEKNSEKTVKYLNQEKINKVIKNGNIEYVVSGNLDKSEFEGLENVAEGIGTDDVIEKIIESNYNDQDLDIPKEVLANEHLDELKNEMIKDADYEIADDLSTLIRKNGDFGAKEVNMRKLVDEETQKITEEVNKVLSPIPDKLKDFDKLPLYKKRMVINKSNDLDFLNLIVSSYDNETIKNLASSRIKEIKK